MSAEKQIPGPGDAVPGPGQAACSASPQGVLLNILPVLKRKEKGSL